MRGEGGRWYGGGCRGRLYTYRCTVTTRMTPALRRAARRAILMFSLTVRDKVRRQSPQTTTFEEGEPERNRIEVLLTSLTPYLQARPAHKRRNKVNVPSSARHSPCSHSPVASALCMYRIEPLKRQVVSIKALPENIGRQCIAYWYGWGEKGLSLIHI